MTAALLRLLPPPLLPLPLPCPIISHTRTPSLALFLAYTHILPLGISIPQSTGWGGEEMAVYGKKSRWTTTTTAATATADTTATITTTIVITGLLRLLLSLLQG